MGLLAAAGALLHSSPDLLIAGSTGAGLLVRRSGGLLPAVVAARDGDVTGRPGTAA